MYLNTEVFVCYYLATFWVVNYLLKFRAIKMSYLKLFKEYKKFWKYKVEDNTGYYDTFGCDGQIDISFYNNDICVLYTVRHEWLYIGKYSKFKIILNENNIDFKKYFKKTIKNNNGEF